ncbi:DUF6443 domain-containing protein [Tenacibaculum sp. M341]|uniref:DUF6443 domain-containing protein n=1 Tax=Tenacibaculum sp. M341 TaxID=2530339 RepID=UPI00104B67F8|nr:DUF6443 domain-containing protein [Tenacibaculum sp. M341]TCI94780.1 hypothetical protein EYW44_00225 [Tenacibaculum sp. M341]
MRKIIYMFTVLFPLLLVAQVQEHRVEENLQITAANGPVTLTATKSITLKPTSLIKLGSNVNFKIIDDVYLPLSLTDDNYVLKRAFQIPTKSTVVSSNNEVIESVTYFDGLGRPKQSIGIKQSPTKKDIVTFIDYDDLGRQTREFLPYAATTSNGRLQTGAEIATQQYYYSNYAEDFPGITELTSINAFSEQTIESSPLNRVQKQAAPGKDWRKDGGHEVEFGYENNEEGEVKLFRVSLSIAPNSKIYKPTLLGNGSVSYSVGQLYKTVTKDENHTEDGSKLHTTEEFKNKEGQVVLKRTYALVNNVEEAHDTYYVYDDFGNLTYVLPPKVRVTDGVSAVELSKLCYQYVYDYRNRLVEKKIPGKDWEYIVYDKLDRPVLTQDANLRMHNQWLFTKYDYLSRVVYTGVYTEGVRLDQESMQLKFDEENISALKQYENKLTTAGSKDIFYSNNNFPVSNTEIYTVSYYDDYTFDRAGAPTSAVLYKGIGNTTNKTKGLATGTKVKVLTTDDWITTVTLYDEKARPVYVYQNNVYLNTTDVVESKLDFVGKVLETKTTHTKRDQNPIVTVDTFSYDHATRLVSQQQKINNQATETIVKNEYDALGQLTTKEVGDGLQKVDYDYNVRGWLTKINEDNNNDNDLFNFELKYNTPSVNGAALFNGNIAQTSWQTENEDNSKKTYTYSYDALNRINAAIGTNTSNYNVSGITYDKNGNIETLLRRGHVVENPDITNNNHFDVMDDLSYNYDSGNKLQGVDDDGNVNYGYVDKPNSGSDYTYDDNGNMISDANKGITNIKYNHLNLPTQVLFSNGGQIVYTYDASGMKLKKEVESSTQTPVATLYAGNYIYEEREGEQANLQFFNHPEGYTQPVIASGSVAISSFEYVYQYKDHLGNVRLSYTDTNGDGVISKPSSTILYEDFSTLDNWSNSPVTLDTEQKVSGNTSGKLKLSTNGNLIAYHNTGVNVNNTISTTYEYSGWLRLNAPQPEGGYIRLMLFTYDNNSKLIEFSEADRVRTSGEWVYVKKRVTVPASAKKLNVRLDIYTNGAYVEGWFDDLKISKVNNTSEIIEESNYYPFGLKHKGYNTLYNPIGNKVAQKFNYQHQELNESLGYNMHEFELRHYDVTLGRFVTTDPYEQFANPYLAMGNNPVTSFDPDGGHCKDANGNVIACPDGDLFDEYRDSEDNHTTILDDVDLDTGTTKAPEGATGEDAMFNQFGEKLLLDQIDFSQVYKQETDEFITSMNKFRGEYLKNFLQILSVLNPWSIAFGPAAGVSPAVRALTTRSLTSTSPLANYVYHTVEGGKTIYVGITNNLSRRAAEHLAQKGINIEPIFNNLSRIDARSVEQALIEIHKLSKNGGTLLNKINSIATKNPIYARSLKRGYDLLKQKGYKY